MSNNDVEDLKGEGPQTRLKPALLGLSNGTVQNLKRRKIAPARR